MVASANKGNSPERWTALLEMLSEKLQMGLLDRLRRVKSYHFEGTELYIEPGNEEDAKYLSKDSPIQQLRLYAVDVCEVEEVRIKLSE